MGTPTAGAGAGVFLDPAAGLGLLELAGLGLAPAGDVEGEIDAAAGEGDVVAAGGEGEGGVVAAGGEGVLLVSPVSSPGNALPRLSAC